MISFKQYLSESYEVPGRQISDKELVSVLGKGRLNSVMKNPFFATYSNYERAYKYGVSAAGFNWLEVYFFFSSVHKTPEGKIRPEIMVKFVFAYTGSGIINAHKYTRSKEPNEMEAKYGPSAGWKHLSDWKKVQE